MTRSEALEAILRVHNVLLGMAQSPSYPETVRMRYLDVARIWTHMAEPGQAEWMLTYRQDLIDGIWITGSDYDVELREALRVLAEGDD